MAARGEITAGAGPAGARVGKRRAGLSSELIAILAVGAMMAGTMLTMMTMMVSAFEENFASIRAEIQSVRSEVESLEQSIRGEIGSLREDVRELRKDVRALQVGQTELRERMARMESKVDMLAGEWPPKPGGSAARYRL